MRKSTEFQNKTIAHDYLMNKVVKFGDCEKKSARLFFINYS